MRKPRTARQPFQSRGRMRGMRRVIPAPTAAGTTGTTVLAASKHCQVHHETAVRMVLSVPIADATTSTTVLATSEQHQSNARFILQL